MTGISKENCTECIHKLNLTKKYRIKAEKAIKDFFENSKFNQKPIATIQEKFEEKDWVLYTTVYAITEEVVHHPKKKDLTSTSDPVRFKKAMEGIIKGEIVKEERINIETYSIKLESKIKWGEDRRSELFNWIQKTLEDTRRNLEEIRNALSESLDELEKYFNVKECINNSLEYAKSASVIVATQDIDKVVEKFNEKGGESFWLLPHPPKDLKLDEPLVDLSELTSVVDETSLLTPPPAPVLKHQSDPSNISTFPGNSPVPLW